MEELVPDKLIAGDYPLVTDIVTVLSGQNLKRGALLGKVALSIPTTGTAVGGNTGNGTCTLVAGKSSAIVETFTLTCTAAGTNSGTFSVIGSKTGRLADATVGVPYLNSCLGFTVNDGTTDFAVGDSFTIAITDGSAKHKLCDSTAVDGSQAPQVILAEDCDASGGDKQAVVYITGAFNQSAVIFGGTDTAATHRAALRDLNIYLKSAA